MKVGVTGTSGYVGQKVVKKLQQNTHAIFKFVRRTVKDDEEISWIPSKQEIDNKKLK